MKKNGIVKHPPEQKEAESLLTVLGAANTTEAAAKAQALIGAVVTEPLLMTVVINRVTGNLFMSSNARGDSVVTDLNLLHAATLDLSKRLSDELVKAASKQVSEAPAA